MHPDTVVKAGYSGVSGTLGDSPAAPSLLFLAGAHPETPGKAGYSGEAPELDCFDVKNTRNELRSSPNQKGKCLS